MFDVGWSEILVIAVVLIVVVGPKDLPRMLRSFGRTTAKFRAMAGDFRRQFDEALREAELDDVKDALNSARGFNPVNEIRKHLSPIEQVGEDVRAGLDDVMKPMPKPEPSAEPVADEPLKTGAAMLPGEDAPKAKTGRKAKAPAAKAAGKMPAAKAVTQGRTKATPATASKPVARSKAASKVEPSGKAAPAAKAAAAKPAARASAVTKARPAKSGAKSAAAVATDASSGLRAKASAKPATAKKPAAGKKTTGRAP